MALKIASHLFYGPFKPEQVKVRANQAPLIIAIVSKSGPAWDPVFHLVDIDYSPDGGVDLADHPRRPQWTPRDAGEVQAYLYDAKKSDGFQNETDRRLFAEKIRGLQPPNMKIGLGGDV
jgi:hypothetical protein